jgi:hypothetical protein
MVIYGIVRINLSGIMDKKENQISIINPFLLSENSFFMQKIAEISKNIVGEF